MAEAAIAMCPESYSDGEIVFTRSERSAPLSYGGDTEFCGERGHTCVYEYLIDETIVCEDDLQKKLVCGGMDSKTTTRAKHIITFTLRYLSDPERNEACSQRQDFCSGDVGWFVSRESPALGRYDDMLDTQLSQFFFKRYDDVQVTVKVDAGVKTNFAVDPDSIERFADSLKESVTHPYPCQSGVNLCRGDRICTDGCLCEGACMPDEPFADKNGCVENTCDHDGAPDTGEDCRHCPDAACQESALCVPYMGRWLCLEGAKTYSAITDLDEGIVFVKRGVDRSVMVPLKKGDRIMDGDEIILRKWSDRSHDTLVEMTWDDGSVGQAFLHPYADTLSGSFFAGKKRNESMRVYDIRDRNNKVIGIKTDEVFPKEHPSTIEMYGKDAADIGLLITTNLPGVPFIISVFSSVVSSPRSPNSPMTYINVRSEIIFSPNGDSTWNLFTIEGAPEVIRLEGGKVQANVTVLPGYKALVSADDAASGLERFDPQEVESIRERLERKRKIAFSPFLLAAAAILASSLYVAKRWRKKTKS